MRGEIERILKYAGDGYLRPVRDHWPRCVVGRQGRTASVLGCVFILKLSTRHRQARAAAGGWRTAITTLTKQGFR